MEILDIRIFKIDIEREDIETIASSVYGEQLERYLQELFEIVMSRQNGRKFYFDRETTEVRSQITRIINNEDFNDISSTIAQRLLTSEHAAQQKIAHLGKSIQKGIVVQAKVKENNSTKFIICKADHNDFLDDRNYQLARGLPVKKKAFKAYICRLNIDTTVDDIIVYDTNPSETKYWWHDFLELTMTVSDEDNTERAFNAIDKSVFTKIKRKHPQDYTYLRNSMVRYFRSTDVFEMNNFLEDTIGNYSPLDSELNIEELKEKIKGLPLNQRNAFDNQFNIIKSKIKARFKSTVKLSGQIDLVFKEDIPNLESVVTAEIGADGSKYVKVKSEDGYHYFKNHPTNVTNASH